MVEYLLKIVDMSFYCKYDNCIILLKEALKNEKKYK